MCRRTRFAPSARAGPDPVPARKRLSRGELEARYAGSAGVWDSITTMGFPARVRDALLPALRHAGRPITQNAVLRACAAAMLRTKKLRTRKLIRATSKRRWVQGVA